MLPVLEPGGKWQAESVFILSSFDIEGEERITYDLYDLGGSLEMEE